MTTTFSTQFDNSFDTVFTNTTHTLTTSLPLFDHNFCGALLKNAGDDARSAQFKKPFGSSKFTRDTKAHLYTKGHFGDFQILNFQHH